jgi:hypothetical protein
LRQEQQRVANALDSAASQRVREATAS